MSGSVRAIYLPPEQPLYVGVSWEIKTKTTLLNYLREYKKEWPKFITEERVKSLEAEQKLKHIPGDIWHWTQPRWQKEGIDPKPDAFGLWGGMIEQWEIDKYPNDYQDHRLSYEMLEEAGPSVVQELKNLDGSSVLDENGKSKRISLFRRICLVYGENKKQGGGKVYNDFSKKTLDSLKNPNTETGRTYEIFFFHVTRINGKFHDTGVRGETEAPEFVPIMSLYPRGSRVEGSNWIYPKHTFGLKVLLRQLINQGKDEYKEPLAHLEKQFRFDEKLGFSEFPQIEPTLDLTDEEVWLRATQGIKKIGSKK